MSSSSRTDFVLGTSITSDDNFIPQIRLPSEENVLRCYLSSMNNAIVDTPPIQRKSIRKKTADLVLQKIKYIYEKASIPTISDEGIRKQIFNLLDEYQKLNKIPLQISSKDHIQGKVKDFLLRIQTTTLACWKSDASLLDEDKEFLENMKTDRTFTIGSLDLKRLQVAQEKIKECAAAKQTVSSESMVIDDDCNTMNDEQDKDFQAASETNETPAKRRHRKTKDGTNIFIPHDILSDPSLVAFETRSHSSVTHTIGFLGTLIEKCGGDKSKVNHSYTHAYRCRVSAVERYAEEVKEGWLCSKPAALHWDGKIMSDIKDK